MIHTQETIAKELKRIQDSVPQLFRDTMFTKVKKTPTLEMVANKVLEESDLTESRRKQVETLVKEGHLSREHMLENPKTAKQRDIWVLKEIKKSVKEGRLPNKKQLKELNIKYYGPSE